jgi:mono/diheme cytochrome c family protein
MACSPELANSDPGDAVAASSSASQVEAGCLPFDAGPLDPNQVELGQQLVMQNKCMGCHGSQLGGNSDGVPSPGIGTAYPPNLTGDPTTGLGC